MKHTRRFLPAAAVTLLAASLLLCAIGIAFRFSIQTNLADGLLLYDPDGLSLTEQELQNPLDSGQYRVSAYQADAGTVRAVLLEAADPSDPVLYAYQAKEISAALWGTPTGGHALSLSEWKKAATSAPAFFTAWALVSLLLCTASALEQCFITKPGKKASVPRTAGLIGFTALCMAGFFFVSQRIAIPNSLLPSGSIFDLSFYQGQLQTIEQLADAFGQAIPPLQPLRTSLIGIKRLMLLQLVVFGALMIVLILDMLSNGIQAVTAAASKK